MSTATPRPGSAESPFEKPAATSADPEKRSCSTANLALRQKQHKLLYWFLPPDSFPMRFETTRIVYFVKLKHASRTFFNLKLQRTAFHSKNAPKKCSQSSPRAPKTSPKCLRELPGDVLRSHTHLQSGPGALPSPNLCSRRRESLIPKGAPGRSLAHFGAPF